MTNQELIRRYLWQRLEDGDIEIFLDSLTPAEVRALIQPEPSVPAARLGIPDIRSVATGPVSTGAQGSEPPARPGARGGLLQALAEHAPDLINEARGGRPIPGERVTPDISTTQTPEPASAPSPLQVLSNSASGCTACRLHEGRTNVVFGEGNPGARVVVVGEAPGREEDRTGRPFVGQAGKLLDLLLLSAGFPREEVYICNVIKCRPPENRDPQPDEVEACSHFLHSQLDAIKPTVLLALGKFAAQTLAGSEETISSLRGTVHDYRGVPLVVTYHPAYLLRSPSRARSAWHDLQLMREVVETASTHAAL